MDDEWMMDGWMDGWIENRYGSCPCGVFSFVKKTMNLRVMNKNECKTAIVSNARKKKKAASVKNLTNDFGLIWRGGALTLRKYFPLSNNNCADMIDHGGVAKQD